MCPDLRMSRRTSLRRLPGAVTIRERGPWGQWEDFDAGLYRADVSDEAVADSVALLADPDQFAEVAAEMVREWPNSAVHNLRFMWTGRNAWIGQASCLYAHGATGLATRRAWGMLTDQQRRAANAVAETIRTRWAQDAEALF